MATSQYSGCNLSACKLPAGCPYGQCTGCAMDPGAGQAELVEAALDPCCILRGVRVLVVEDVPALALRLALVLRQAGCIVRTAPDGQAALEMCNDGWFFDILVSDVDMPRMSGLALLMVLRRERPWLPVVLVTSEPDRIDVQSALLAEGPSFVLPKAVPARQLLALLVGLMCRRFRSLNNPLLRLERPIR